MAATNALNETVNRLAQQLECELQSYTPTSPPPHTKPGPQRYLFPTGAFALGLWHPGDDVHLVCLTDNSVNTFWEYVAEKLEREDLPKFDCILTSPDEELCVWLHYCKIPPHFDLVTLENYGFPNLPQSARHPRYVEQNLARLQDTWHISHDLGDAIDLFRDAYQTLRSWAEAAGIFSKDFGTLDADTLLWLLFDINSTSVLSTEEGQTSLPGAIKAFVNHYQSPASLDMVCTPSRQKVYKPPPPVAASSTAVIVNEIHQLAQHPSLLTCSRADHYQRFCKNYNFHMLISAECWAPKHRGRFHVQLVKAITKTAGEIAKTILVDGPVRIWPHAFKAMEDEWKYVIGVELFLTSPTKLAPRAETREETLVACLERFDASIDSSIGGANMNICEPEEASRLPDEVPAEPTSSLSQDHDPSNAPSSLPSSTTPEKFPPASKVLSRLRWDPAHVSYNYEVGYLDRFEGLMWLPLEKWGRATEEEDFVPEHRIRVFRRIEKGGAKIVVWEREKRFCALGG